LTADREFVGKNGLITCFVTHLSVFVSAFVKIPWLTTGINNYGLTFVSNTSKLGHRKCCPNRH